MTRANDEALAVRARQDAEDARRWSAQMMEAGRIEFGALLAQFAVSANVAAQRAENRLSLQLDQDRDLEMFPAAPQPASAPPVPVVPGNRMDEAGGWHGPGACQLGTPGHYNATICGPAADTPVPVVPGAGPTGDGDADLGAAAQPVDEPLTDVVTTSRCTVQVRRVGHPVRKCWGGIYLETAAGVWRHVDPGLDGHHTPWPAMDGADPMEAPR